MASMATTTKTSKLSSHGFGLNVKTIASGLAMAFVANILYGIGIILNKHYLLQDWSKWTVEDMRTNTTWIRKDIPITCVNCMFAQALCCEAVTSNMLSLNRT